MVLSTDKSFKDEFSKGLYYLNSHYLKPISFYAKLKSLEFANYDPLELFSGVEPRKVFEVAKRQRNIKRNDFQKIEPIVLYNYAISVQNEQRFLSYYRVLEFFIEQALIKRTGELRCDSNISDEQLIQEINLKSEEKQLSNLLNVLLTPIKKRKLT